MKHPEQVDHLLPILGWCPKESSTACTQIQKISLVSTIQNVQHVLLLGAKQSRTTALYVHTQEVMKLAKIHMQ
jgi:hypothetical protein